MAAEKQWGGHLQPRLQAALRQFSVARHQVQVGAGNNLTYAYEILTYGPEGPNRTHIAKYETDLLVYDLVNSGGCLQVHHRNQLALEDEPVVTKTADLAVVCANCHMLIHFDPKKALQVEVLRQMLHGDQE